MLCRELELAEQPSPDCRPRRQITHGTKRTLVWARAERKIEFSSIEGFECSLNQICEPPLLLGANSHDLGNKKGQWDWLICLLLVWMFLACCFPLFDADLFWHLKTGEWIIQNGTVPGFDLYTFTDLDKRWVDLHWGFQVVSAMIYRIGGANLLVLSKAATLTLALCIGCLGSGSSLAGWKRVLCWLLPAIAISARGYRPEIASLVCLAIWMAIIGRLETERHWVWALPVLQVIWINFHALYILGLVVGACYAVDHFARTQCQRRFGIGSPPSKVSTRMVANLAVLCTFASLANPYFEEGSLFPLVLLQKFSVPAAQKFYSFHISEFRMPIQFFRKHGFGNLYLNAQILLWLVTFISFGMLAARRRFSIFRSLVFAAFSYLAWQASRNINIFSIVSGFVLADNVAACARKTSDAPATTASRFVWIRHTVGLTLVTMIVAVTTGGWNQLSGRLRPFGLGEARAKFPHAAAKFLGQDGFPNRVFASDFGAAAVYIYHNGPERKVFMDGRLEVCSMLTFQRFEQIKLWMAHADPAWTEMLRDPRGELPAVLLDVRNSAAQIEGAIRTPGWRMVFSDQAAVVLLDAQTVDALQLPSIGTRRD